MAAQEHEARWREALETMGASRVRRRLGRTPGDAAATAAITGIVAEPPHPSRRFVETWHREAHRREFRSRYGWLNLLAIAAVTVVGGGVILLAVA